MQFSAEHRFQAPCASVAGILGDPDFYRSFELPDLRLLDVQELIAAGPGDAPVVDRVGSTVPAVRLLLRYEFAGGLDPMAHRLLGGTRLTWSQELRILGIEGGAVSFEAEANPRLLHGRADFTFERDGEGMVRHLRGELEVAVPVVGSMAERRIVPGILRRLDVEAEAVRCRLTSS